LCPKPDLHKREGEREGERAASWQLTVNPRPDGERENLFVDQI